MNFVAAIVAGLVGTAAMTILMMLAPMMGMPKMDIVGMLGSMFTTNQGTAKLIGLVIHFMMGIIFAIIYALLWSFGVGASTWLWGLVFGFVHGLVAILTMPMMMKMHPRPPEMTPGPRLMMGQILGHLVYGLVTALVYVAMI